MLKIISSMATRLLLAELAAKWQTDTGMPVSIESVGGLDAAIRVREGEAFDAVVLSRDAIEKLMESGHVVPASRVDLARSCVAVAVKTGAPVPDIRTEAALRKAVEAASSVGYSTGPSGVAIIALLSEWGLVESPHFKIVQTPPGVPVGSLVARGELALGFQQLSELMHLEGITVVGTLPDPVDITTVFSSGVCTLCTQHAALGLFLAYLQTEQAASVKQQHGMQAIDFAKTMAA